MINDSGVKFDANGRALPYFGNTIISFINRKGAPIYEGALWAQEQLKQSEFADCLAFLPEDSFHMTILTLCREIDRGTGSWPAWAGDEEAIKSIDGKLKKIVDTLPFPEDIIMEVDKCDMTKILLKPANEYSKKALSKYRDEVSEMAMIRHSWHDGFRYHITLDYQIKELNKKQEESMRQLCEEISLYLKRTIDLFSVETPEFVIFNDMMKYHNDLSKRC